MGDTVSGNDIVLQDNFWNELLKAWAKIDNYFGSIGNSVITKTVPCQHWQYRVIKTELWYTLTVPYYKDRTMLYKDSGVL